MDEMITPQKINRNAIQIQAEVLSNKKVGPYHHMVFAVGDMAAHSKPGNFVAISVGGEQSSLILRRAFAIYRASDKGPMGGSIELVVAPHGQGSKWLCNQNVGAFVDMVGPLGTAFGIPTTNANTMLSGGGYGVFDEELKKIMPIEAVIIEPSVLLAEICRNKGLSVVEKFMEEIVESDLPVGRKCFVSFELFEHLHDPNIFLENVFNNMKTDDIFIFTTLSGMGIDIQLLCEHSKALSPPHHLNFFNPKSVSNLLIKHGFEVLSAITPGKLDMDILYKNKNLIKDPYWKNLFSYLDQNELEKMQEKIVEMGISSHMMVTCQKT